MVGGRRRGCARFWGQAKEKTETQVGQLVHVHKIAGLPAPLVAGPPGIEGPEEPGGRGGRGCRWITRR